MAVLDTAIFFNVAMAGSSPVMMRFGDVIHSRCVNLHPFTIAAYQAA